MKKLVFVLLILLVLNDFALGAGLKDEWEKIKAIFKKGKDWLVAHDLWDPLVKALKEGGHELAVKLCKKKCEDPTICVDVVNWIFNHLP